MAAVQQELTSIGRRGRYLATGRVDLRAYVVLSCWGIILPVIMLRSHGKFWDGGETFSSYH